MAIQRQPSVPTPTLRTPRAYAGTAYAGTMDKLLIGFWIHKRLSTFARGQASDPEHQQVSTQRSQRGVRMPDPRNAFHFDLGIVAFDLLTGLTLTPQQASARAPVRSPKSKPQYALAVCVVSELSPNALTVNDHRPI